MPETCVRSIHEMFVSGISHLSGMDRAQCWSVCAVWIRSLIQYKFSFIFFLYFANTKKLMKNQTGMGFLMLLSGKILDHSFVWFQSIGKFEQKWRSLHCLLQDLTFLILSWNPQLSTVFESSRHWTSHINLFKYY